MIIPGSGEIHYNEQVHFLHLYIMYNQYITTIDQF